MPYDVLSSQHIVGKLYIAVARSPWARARASIVYLCLIDFITGQRDCSYPKSSVRCAAECEFGWCITASEAS